MPALKPTGLSGEITWLGHVEDRDSTLRATPVKTLELGFDGPAGEAHAGLTRPSCSRVVAQYPRGTEIRNTRQLCVVSEEELAAIAAEMGLASLDPALIGASVVIRGLPDLTHLPPSSRLQTPALTTLVVDMENRPCHLPAPVIDAEAPGFGRGFKPAAKDRRGVTAWVEHPGPLVVGDPVSLHIPDQRAWMPDG